jgi:hypothetical protein
MLKIHYSSEEAAQQMTLTGWVSSRGLFFTDEHLARFDGCTHLLCKCGNEMERRYTDCSFCRKTQEVESYKALEFKEWEGEFPLTLFDHDEYFWDEDDIINYCEENDVQCSDLMLVFCQPRFAKEIDADDYLCDILEYGSLSDIDLELAIAFDNLNSVIRSRKQPLSWVAGKIRTKLEKKND